MHEWPSLDVRELMVDGWTPTPFRQFILKLHSRCDLACKYCYVYEMADSSWRSRPKTMSTDTINATALRIGEHCRTHDLEEIELILHGGEPLLAGQEPIRETIDQVRRAVAPGTKVMVSLQTNGTLLNLSYLELFNELQVNVGVSLDGDELMHDRNRRWRHGKGSHSVVTKNLRLLASPPFRHLFGGLLCTVDIRNDPIGAYEALLEFDPPAIDFLLPHGNWSAPPPGRDRNTDRTPYADWLIEVFGRWYHTPRQRTHIRLFNEIIHMLLGGASASEQIGVSPAAMVVVETDGEIEQSDFLKSVYQGAARTGLHVNRNSFDEVLLLPSIAARQIGLSALSAECRKCHVVEVCGGGLYAHRYRAGHGFANPSVYCPDLLRLILHIRQTVAADLQTHSVQQRAEGISLDLREHRIPAEVFAELAAGGGGSPGVARLAATQRSKHVLLVRGVLDTARRSEHPETPAARRAYDLLAAIERNDRDAVAGVLYHPAVGAWARHVIKTLESRPGEARPAQLAALAAAAAIRSGTVCDIDVPVVDGVLTLPSLGRATLPPTVTDATVICSTEGAEISADGVMIAVPADPHEDSPGWQGLRTLSAHADGISLHALVDDLDPYRIPREMSPHGRLSSADINRWQMILDEAWQLLVRHHRPVADEVAAAVTVLTPLSPSGTHATSATSRERFGCVALSMPPDARAFALTLAHETQHAKLSALLDVVPLCEPDDGSRYYAPWRDDPRPVTGLLQGAYAHLAVADFWRRQQQVETGADALEAYAEFSRWREGSRMVTQTLLDSGRLTDAGTTFVNGMVRRLDLLTVVTVPAAGRALAYERAERHRTRWRERNG